MKGGDAAGLGGGEALMLHLRGEGCVVAVVGTWCDDRSPGEKTPFLHAETLGLIPSTAKRRNAGPGR